MTFVPSSSQLRGVPYEVAELYGKPHLGARYRSSSVKSNRLEEGAVCQVCGAKATNSHHIAPLGMGGGGRVFPLQTPMGLHMLKPSLMAVCGFGNASGCHGRIHQGEVNVRWVWDSDEFAERWWNGDFLRHMWPHGVWLWEYGCYEISDACGRFEIRGPL